MSDFLFKQFFNVPLFFQIASGFGMSRFQLLEFRLYQWSVRKLSERFVIFFKWQNIILNSEVLFVIYDSKSVNF